MDKNRREEIVKRVSALLPMTVDNGCTEAESLVAANKATNFIDEYLKDNGNNLHLYGEIRLDSKELEQVTALCHEAIQAWPNHAGLYLKRGIVFQIEYCQYDNAIADYSEAIRLEPDNAKAYADRGWAWYENGDLDKAIADCIEATRLKPELTDAYVDRGFIWIEKNEYDKAILDLRDAIRLEPMRADAYYYRGVAWRKTGGEDDRAITDFTAAIRLKPDYTLAYHNRGNTWNDKCEYDKAIADFTEAIRLEPDFILPYHNRGYAWYQKGDKKKAISDYQKALTIAPNLEVLRKLLKDQGLDV